MSLLWKPLLAATLPSDADLDALPYPLWGSPKIDGFRCMVQGGVAVTRKGIKYRNTAVQDIYGHKDYEGLDGELCAGPPWAKDVFNRTQNCVNSGKPEAAEVFRKYGCFYVFGWYGASNVIDDMWDDVVNPFYRMQIAMSEYGEIQGGYFRQVAQTAIKNSKQLQRFEEKCLKRGFEGVMLTRFDRPAYPQKPGKENRSTLNEFWLVKLKRFDYATAMIVDVHYLEHNENEEKTASGRKSTKKSGLVVDKTQIGSVTMATARGLNFSLTVPTDLLRKKGVAWWHDQVGKTIRYKYQLAGTLNKPRCLTATFEELL
jgi:DNA ligase-1